MNIKNCLAIGVRIESVCGPAYLRPLIYKLEPCNKYLILIITMYKCIYSYG